jgi:hypothetical protein
VPRLRSDIFVAALVRQASVDGAFAAVTHKGAAEAGAIFVKIARLDRTADLYGPAPQSLADDDGDRRFERLAEREIEFEVDERVRRELRFDPDCWVVEIEDRQGRSFGLALAEG